MFSARQIDAEERRWAPRRRARQIANREARIAAAGRLRETLWFNLALASLNLSRAEEARQYATRVVDHPQFADRAREILARLP